MQHMYAQVTGCSGQKDISQILPFSAPVILQRIPAEQFVDCRVVVFRDPGIPGLLLPALLLTGTACTLRIFPGIPSGIRACFGNLHGHLAVRKFRFCLLHQRRKCPRSRIVKYITKGYAVPCLACLDHHVGDQK